MQEEGEEAEEEEGGESEQEENAESDPSGDSQNLATRRPKRTVKANKMDDHIYYNSKNGARTSAEAGLSAKNANVVDSGKSSKRRKLGSSESEDRASKYDDEDDDENEAELR